MHLIPLTRGKFAKVDDEDFDLVSRFKWRAFACRNWTGNWYAVSTMEVNGKRRTVYMHRFITESKTTLDHKDGNGLNNQKENLRPATRVENGRNRKVQKHSSPYKGVSWFGPAKAYMVKICVNQQDKYLGCFKNPIEGARVYDEAAIKYFGPFARTNEQMGVLRAF